MSAFYQDNQKNNFFKVSFRVDLHNDIMPKCEGSSGAISPEDRSAGGANVEEVEEYMAVINFKRVEKKYVLTPSSMRH